MYPISEQLIKLNRSWRKLSPQGFVIHSTDNPNDTAQKEHDYYNSRELKASVHYFVGTTIIRCVPELEEALHAGPTANSKYLSVEMCEGESFDQVWARTVWLVADACVRYGWTTGPNVYSHRGISAMYKETDHTDPIAYLARNGKTWEQLLEAIDTEIENIKKGVVAVGDAPKKVIDPNDIYLSVRVLEPLADQAIKDINKLGFAALRMPLA